uniref:Integrin beta n=1 Tax=Sinocyclocheilus rhinocerous TaxID=307959 RepID=A0A673LWI9_9TELE
MLFRPCLWCSVICMVIKPIVALCMTTAVSLLLFLSVISLQLFEYERCDLKENLQSCMFMHSCAFLSSFFQNVQIDKSLKYSQVAPQLMSMTLLPGEEKEVEMEVFEPARGPLDLYILMDFSNSMSDDLDNLKRMGDQLAQLVGKLSDDYTIGFGKFVDKVTEPQTDMRPSKLAVPWANSDPPFSFRNVISLTNNINTFRQKLQRERISGNLDAPEGGFDAILQTAVCQEQIGWRKQSTHLLVFSTESAFHYEADGANVLAGILDRNDEQCHMTPDGNYTHDIRQDYPSIPTLVRLLVKHNIIPIFAVTNHSYSYYEKLSEYFPIAELGQLQEDSSNILNILDKAFQNIRSKISIRAEDRPKAVEAKILSQSGTFSEFGNFKINPGETGKFKVRLKALNQVGEQHVCNANQADRAGTLRVKPTTFSSAFRINAEVLCQTCDCEKTPVKNAVRCNSHGDLVCGKCQCYDGWLGPFCNCSAGSSTDSAMCIEPGKTKPCSGRGDCMCGTCVCYNPNQFEGPFCHFDKSQCQRFGGFLCNERGSCSMGRCVCTPGWTGDACECPISNGSCLDTKGGICNGRGVCKCGRCECEHSGLPLSPTCEANFQQQLGMCEAKRSCVQCQAWNTGERKGRKCEECFFKIIMVEELEEGTTSHLSFILKDIATAFLLSLKPQVTCCLTCCVRLACLALLPCCGRGRMVGFKEDHYMLRQSLSTTDHLDTPMVRTGPPKSTDIVRWKVTDNVHRGPNHPQNQIKPNPKETIQYPVSLRLNRQYSDTLSNPEARDTDMLRREVEDNVSAYKCVIETIIILICIHRQNNTIVDTVLSAPRACYPDIVKLTDKQVQAGNFRDLKVVPGYYTVASDREAAGAVEFQEGVESVDVRVPLFIKDEDDEKKELLVQAVDVPVGIAKIGKDHVNITVIKEHARSIFTFLQPSYTYSRQDGVANIPISREIIEDGRTQVTYCTRDLTAKDKKDYISADGDLNYAPGETQKTVPVKLLELGEGDGLLEDKQVKQFVMDLSNPRQGAKLGRYPRTTITIADKPGRLYSPTNIKAVATGPKNIRLNWNPRANANGYKVEKREMEEKDAQVLDVKTPQAELTNLYPYCDYEMRVCGYNVLGEGNYSDVIQCQTLEDGKSVSGLCVCSHLKFYLLFFRFLGKTNGVKYWIYGDPEADAQVLDVKTPQAELTNLYPYCDYEMRVCGYNVLGEGNYSDVIQCQTLEDVPGEPGRLAFNVISPTVTQVSWAEPAETNGVITSYEVIYTPIDEDKKPIGPSKKVMIDNPKKRMLLIENLQPSQTYCYKVRARNKVGWGPYRDATINLASQPTRPMSIPIIPDIPIVDAEAGDEYDSYLMYSNEVLRSPTGSQRPSVTDLTEGGYLVMGCTVATHIKQHNCFQSTLILKEMFLEYQISEVKRIEVNNPAQNSVVVQDLLPNHSYIFKVKAQSREGWGPEREGVITIESAVDPKSPLSPVPGSPFTLSTPSAPGPLIFTALSPDTLQLSWEKPRKPNGDILGYVVTCEQLHGGGDLRSFQVNGNAATSLTVSDLKENMPYKFKVQAQTTQGFGPEREGIITIESQDGGMLDVTTIEVFNLPTEMTSHTMFSEPFVSPDGMMMMSSRQITESGGTITRQVEMVQRGVMSSSTVTKKVDRQYYEA